VFFELVIYYLYVFEGGKEKGTAPEFCSCLIFVVLLSQTDGMVW